LPIEKASPSGGRDVGVRLGVDVEIDVDVGVAVVTVEVCIGVSVEGVEAEKGGLVSEEILILRGKFTSGFSFFLFKKVKKSIISIKAKLRKKIKAYKIVFFELPSFFFI